MTNNEFDYLLTDQEQHALDPAVHHRALAVREIGRMGALMGADATHITQALETVRGLDKSGAKQLHKAARQVLALLNMTQSDTIQPIENSVDRVILTSEHVDDPVLDDKKTINTTWLETATREQLDSVSEVEHAMDYVRGGFEELLEMAGSSWDCATFDPSRCEATLARLHACDVTVETMDDAYVEKLIAMHLRHSKFTHMSARIVDSICFWGYLKGVKLTNIVSFRAVTKPYAKEADVHNSRTAVERGVRHALEVEKQLSEEQEVFDQRITWDPSPAQEGDSNGVASDVVAFEELPSTPEPVISKPLPETEQHERSLDEEPVYVREAEYFGELLGLDSAQRAATRSLFDPGSRGIVTDNMQSVIAVLNERITNASTGSDILTNLTPDNARGKIAFRRLVGRFSDPTQRLVKRPAVRLYDQFRKDTPAERDAKVAAFNAFLPVVRDVLLHNPNSQLLAPKKMSEPLLHIGNDGKIMVAVR